jgi:hypothetical protein
MRLPRLLRSRRLAMTEGKIATPPLREARNYKGERPPKAGVVAKIIKTSINFFLDHHWWNNRIKMVN